MLPISLLNKAVGKAMLVELKNGETYNGHLVGCDNFMNINLREVTCTSPDGENFWKIATCYIKGSTVKYLRLPEEVIDMVKEDPFRTRRGGRDDRRGGRGGGPRGRGGDRGGRDRGRRGYD